MSDAPGLKTCPFCRDPMVVVHDVLQHVIQTEGCPLKQMAWGHSAAIREWNSRATTVAQVPEVAALIEAVRDLQDRCAELDEGRTCTIGDTAIAAFKDPKP